MSAVGSPSGVLVVGAGGHARVCVEALRETGWRPVGAVDREGSAATEVLGVPVLGRDVDAARLADDAGVGAVCVAIGDNGDRRRWSGRLEELGLRAVTVVAASAVVSPSATVAEGVQLLPGAVVNAAAVIGRGTIVNTNATVDHDCVVGDFTHIAPGAVIGGDVAIGDDVLVGIGARVVPATRIGDGAVVGAGAVVVADVPAGATVVGVPAAPQRRPSRSGS